MSQTLARYLYILAFAIYGCSDPVSESNLSDAGQANDVGPTNDAGSTADVGPINDAGSTVDAGLIADVGPIDDAGPTDDAGPAADVGPTEDAGSTEDAGPTADAGGSNPGETEVPPTESTALFAWLQSRAYQAFPAEASVHASSGPHGMVRTFVNRQLADSLSAGAAEHPVGAAAVKELHNSSGLMGWAVTVKTTSLGNDADHWYWYENLSIVQNAPAVDGQGVATCVNCHRLGTDQIRSSGPFIDP